MSQKIVIPKGLINPNETTIIEIPEAVQNIETVVAKPFYNRNPRKVEKKFGKGDKKLNGNSHKSRQNLVEEEINEYDIENEGRLENGTVKKSRINYLKSVINGKMDIYNKYPEGNYIDVYEDYVEDFTYNNVLHSNYRKKHRKISSSDYENYQEREYYLKPSPPTRAHRLSRLKGKNLCNLDLVKILDIMDQIENQRLQKNLFDYQAARRKLIYETTNLHSVNDIFANIDIQK